MRYICLALAFALIGCSTSYPRYASHNDPVPTQQQFVQDRYACLLQTQQTVTAAAFDKSGGGAVSRVMPSCSAFNACLAARGYYRVDDTKNLDVFNIPGNFYVPKGAKVTCNDDD
jgi:hypothetical protein